MFSFSLLRSPQKGDDSSDDENEKRVYEAASHDKEDHSNDTERLKANDAVAAANTPSRLVSASFTATTDPQSFEEVHHQTCLKHHSLYASCAQMSTPNRDFVVPRRKQVLLWKTRQKKSEEDSTTLEFLAKHARHLGWNEPSTTSGTSSLASSVASWVSRRLSASFQEDDDSDEDIHHVSAQKEACIQPTDMVLCEALVLECLRFLMRLVRTSPVSDTNTSQAWLLHGDDEFSYRQWILQQSQSSNNISSPCCSQLLACLSANETLWLCRLLEHGGVLKVVTRPESTLLVLGGGKSSDSSTSRVDRCLAVLDLLQARSRLERLALSSQNQVATLQQRALQHKRHNQIKSATTVLQRSKVYQQQADHAHKVLLTVEQSLNALESSTMTNQVLHAIQQANNVLKLQRVDIDQVDEVLEDLAEHVELGQQVDFTLASVNNAAMASMGLDDDALLQELQNLTLQEARTNATTNIKADVEAAAAATATAMLPLPPIVAPLAANEDSSSSTINVDSNKEESLPVLPS